MRIPAETITVFQDTILSWWKNNKRDLPWRHTRDPYKILVSEMMLQQTQVARVVPKYHAFLSRFPTISYLAEASAAEVLRNWKGMGYNRRALYLRNAAKAVVSDHNGIFPNTEKALMKLPGVGTYTAHALLVFAFEKDVAVIDTNVRKIIVHFFFDDKPPNDHVIEEVAIQLVPHGKSWNWHQALMDYGAIELQKRVNRKPACAGRSLTVNRKTKEKPFRETKRFYRGRIIDRLREGSVEEHILCRECMQNYGKTEDYHGEIIKDLEKENLVTRKKGIISLPE